MSFKVGDKIIYTSGKWGDSDANPLWNGSHGNIVGTVNEPPYRGARQMLWVPVRWDNGCKNQYQPEDLRPHKPIILDKELFEL